MATTIRVRYTLRFGRRGRDCHGRRLL